MGTAQSTFGLFPASKGSANTASRLKRVAVFPLFWVALVFVAIGAVLNAGSSHAFPIAGAVALMLIGGLPHGAYDIAIARASLNLGATRAICVLLAYIAVALAMASLWAIAPLIALPVFLMLSAVHFGEDWLMLEASLLRVMAGATIICVPAFFREAEVAVLFTTMAGPGADKLLSLTIACTPVALLVSVVGTAQAWRAGHRQWAVAQIATLITLATTPPQIGFLLYFVFLHAPLHMSELSSALPSWSRSKTWVYGSGICAVTLGAGILVAPGFLSGNVTALSADSFRLLSIVAAPHLLLTSILKQVTANRDRLLPARQEASYRSFNL